MGQFIDLTGRRFTRLEVIRLKETNNHKAKLWECLCDCGSFCNVFGYNLKSGHTKSCGCLDREKAKERTTKHGMYGTQIYKIWAELQQRCFNTKHTFYKNYGGRGITVCDSWLKFENFYQDMGDVPEGCQIDRIDNNKGYYKKNCRWITPKENCRNRSSNVEITFNGKTQCIAAWEEELGFNHGTLWKRLYQYYWPVERAFTEPVKDSNRKPVTFNGKTQSLTKHAKDHGLGLTTVVYRLGLGWDLSKALTTPKKIIWGSKK